MEVLQMLSNEIVNIVIQVTDESKVKQVDGVIQKIKNTISKKIGKSKLTICEVEVSSMIKSIRAIPTEHDGNVIVNIIKDLDNTVNVLSHSHRFHSLDAKDNCRIRQITNIQFNLGEPTNFISFSTGDDRTAELVVNELMSICNISNQRKERTKKEEVKCSLIQKQLELSF